MNKRKCCFLTYLWKNMTYLIKMNVKNINTIMSAFVNTLGIIDEFTYHTCLFNFIFLSADQNKTNRNRKGRIFNMHPKSWTDFWGCIFLC